LSHAQTQMARELGMNPRKLGRDADERGAPDSSSRAETNFVRQENVARSCEWHRLEAYATLLS